MQKSRLIKTLVFALAMVLTITAIPILNWSTASSSGGVIFKSTSTLQTVKLDQNLSSFEDLQTLTVSAAKGETDATQFIVNSAKEITNYDLVATDLTCGQSTISAENIDVYVQIYTYATDNVLFVGTYGGGYYPDCLIPISYIKNAKENNVNIFSTSALRYASELYDFNEEKEIISIGGGGLFQEYSIHQVEIIVRVMGIGAEKVKVESAYGDGYIADILYADGRKAQLNYDKKSDFYVTVTTKDGKEEKRHLASDYFKNLLEKIAIFFETGKTDFNQEQTLEVMKIREGAVKGTENLGVWLDL